MSNYDEMRSNANKLLNEDGSIQTLSGTIILPANTNRAEQYKLMRPTVNKLLNEDGSITTFPNSGEGGTNLVSSVNGKQGAVVLTSEDIIYIDEDATSITIKQAIDFLLNTGVTQEQLKLINMADNQVPNDDTLAYRPYLDTDKQMKYSPLVQIGEDNTQETLIFSNEIQLINVESGPTEIIFGGELTKGTSFVKSGNGIQILDTSNNFSLTSVINYSFNNVWLLYPITLYVYLMKNGVSTGTYEKIVVNQSAGSVKLTGFDSEDIIGLVPNDILTLEVEAVDSSGNIGDGSWAQFSIGTNSNFSVYYRDIVSSGFADPIENSWARRFIINKTDSATIPSGTLGTTNLGIITLTDSTIYTNTNTITFNNITNAIHINTEQKYAFNLFTSLPIAKTGENAGSITLLAHVEYNNDGTWGEYNPFNNSRNIIVAGATKSVDFASYIRLEFVGEYRIRFYWLNTGSGTLTHNPSAITVGLGGILGGSATLDQLGKIELIGQPIS